MALRINPRLGQFAAGMRKEPTPFEQALWARLRSSQLGGLKFRRQTVIGTVIVDFFCPSIGLVVEIDGDTHDPVADARRDNGLNARGFSVLRFTNADVGGNIDGVLQTILMKAGTLPPRFTHPSIPSLEREGRP
jgi:very-short-patch-repair endonuclease